jgi:very-short-patch-repair endonuclease
VSNDNWNGAPPSREILNTGPNSLAPGHLTNRSRRAKAQEDKRALARQPESPDPPPCTWFTKQRGSIWPSPLLLRQQGWLKESGIPYQTPRAIGRSYSDFYLPDPNTALEVNGCYWQRYVQVEGFHQGSDEAPFLSAGYSLLLIWECEINMSPAAALRKIKVAAGIR